MAPQDSFIEEEEDTCPLCIEEFDLSDRNFRPCPCGYQNNMNGLCPACRRPYDEKTIQWKVVTQEEVAEFRANIQKNQKKQVQKREAEKENLVQKNLVYITGLAPTTLRKPEFFGQYGNIQKISISNRKSSDGQHQSLGIYATRCIQAVHGSQNGDRILKAQHGTTKYCSAWLKNEKCGNPGCMFLHEQGDEEDSYSRQDLSSMNSIHTQRPLPGGGSSRSVSRQQGPQPTPPPVVSHPMARSLSKDGSENGADGSALPSSASWARNPQRSRRGSHATSGAASSPAVSMSLPVTAEPVPEEAVEEEEEEEPVVEPPPTTSSKAPELPTPSPPRPEPKTIPEGSLIALLRALQACTLPGLVSAEVEGESPPLFDIRGGEKRKAMREEEDSRLSGEKEEQVEAREPSEGEPETGGSLALGGEPEDRDVADNGFDQRRPSTQPPIQRNNNDGIFGPALSGSNFNQNPGNPLSRTMTPQQIFLRSQSGFDVPPGIGNQVGNFQTQSHNRQSSRFSFANDNPSTATSVKLAANPRIMAQQSAMMPNSFQSQNNNQFYGTSMPGPPPGLKSTGTPPSMFGQGFGGAGFGGAPKDNSNELLQSLIGRSRGGNSQAHDAGKPPASGLLASLYGNQPGAFQDMGSKQKKKGKKHRHANTSSSGGVVYILQARMQHQPQGNAGVGQGLFGGQSQGGYNPNMMYNAVYFQQPAQEGSSQASHHRLPQNPLYDDLLSLDEASNVVDALVSDEPIDLFDTHDRPLVPPGLAIPPGLANISRPSSTRPQSRLGNIVPALPKFPPGLVHGALTPDQSPQKSEASDTEKKNVRVVSTESSLSREMSTPAKQLNEEDFPSLDALKISSRPATPTPKATPKAKKRAERIAERLLAKMRDETEPVPAPAAKATENKISEAKSVEDKADEIKATEDERVEKEHLVTNTMVPKASQNSGEASTEVEKLVVETSAAFPPLPTPGTTVSSPVTRVGPKSLRVVPVTKTESAPPASPALTMASVAYSTASRAVSASYRPDTPGSEMISDTASMVSASATHSRASSPPPTRVGSAAVRTTTKSQLKKARKEVLKQETKAIADTIQVVPEEHAPVFGRKKKQKKEKPAKVVAQSPAKEPVKEVTKEETPTSKLEAKPMPAPEVIAQETLDQTKATQKKVVKGKGKAKEKSKEPESSEEEAAMPPPPPPPSNVAGASKRKVTPATYHAGPANIFDEIRKSLWTNSIEKLQLLKPFTNSAPPRVDRESAEGTQQIGHCLDCSCKCGEILEEDLAALREGKSVRKQFHVDGSRMLITPNGDCIRGLTLEEEDAFLQLQAAIASTAENPGSFIAPRHQPGSGAFSLIKGRAVPNGRPNIFPASSRPQAQDPIGKLQREDALSYINQYVLPRLNLGATNMGLPKGSATATTKDAAAASLNSLAPYFYGPDAAAGVGIYSPPDGARPINDFSPPAGLASVAGLPPHDREGIPAGKIMGTSPGGMPLMSVEDAEGALATARRETEKLEKGLNQVIRRNRRLILGGNS
ncbi:hypothetical protein BGZ63DRAFT_415897 [Mariannaea sp. PMI_226]|nr:hypothetical protein BGZ63DRAFT_415897 [Mariannaea sp. PMI_226]